MATDPDLELRDKSDPSRVLAVYKAVFGWKKRGTFFLRKREGAEEEEDMEREMGDWEHVVLLTGCGVLEASRRRARQRSSNGGGGC